MWGVPGTTIRRHQGKISVTLRHLGYGRMYLDGQSEECRLDEPITGPGVISEIRCPRGEKTRVSDQFLYTGPVEGEGKPGRSVRREKRDPRYSYLTKIIKYSKQLKRW